MYISHQALSHSGFCSLSHMVQIPVVPNRQNCSEGNLSHVFHVSLISFICLFYSYVPVIFKLFLFLLIHVLFVWFQLVTLKNDFHL